MIKYKFRKTILAAGVLGAALFAQSAFAAETVNLGLEDAMQRAFATNPAISISGYEVESARASYNAAREARGLSIGASHTTRRSGNDDNIVSRSQYWTDTGNFVGTRYVTSKGIGNTHSNTISASLPLYTGGKLSGAVDQARANYKYNLVGQQRAYNEMRTTVTNGYFKVLQTDDSRKLSRESVARLEDHLKNVQAQYDVGVVAKADLLRSQVELANAQQTLIQAESAYDVAEASLNRVVGLPMDTKLNLDNLLVHNEYPRTLEECLAYASENRPELAQAKYNVDAAKGALKVARSGHMPQIAATASQNWNNTNWPGDKNGNWGVGVSVDLNVFDSGVTLSKIHGAEADLKKAEETYRNTVDGVDLEVRTDYLNLREAEKRIATTELAVEQAEEDYRIAQLRYMNGVGTNTDVMDAQVALTTAKNNHLQALYDYNTSKTTLETAIGVPMTYPTAPVTVEPAK